LDLVIGLFFFFYRTLLGGFQFLFYFLDSGPLSLAFHLKLKKKEKKEKKKRKKEKKENSHSQSNWGGGLPISH